MVSADLNGKHKRRVALSVRVLQNLTGQDSGGEGRGKRRDGGRERERERSYWCMCLDGPTHFRDSSRHLVAPTVMARWNGEEPVKSGAVMYAPGGREGGRGGGREGGRERGREGGKEGGSKSGG